MLMKIDIIDLPMITVIGKEGLCTTEKILFNSYGKKPMLIITRWL